MTTDAEIVIGIRGKTEGGRRVKRSLDDIKKSGREATNSTKRLRSEIDATNRAATALGRAFGTLIVTYAGSQGVRALTRVSDAYTVVENKLKLVTDSAEDLARVQQELIDIGDRTFTSLQDNATLFNRLTISTREFNATQKDVLRATEALQQTFRLSGATMQEAANSTIQFAQGLASGALRGDEFRSVSENNIRLQKLLAEGLGISTGKLKEMADEGQLTAERIFPILSGSLEKLNEETSEISPTFDQAFSKVQEKLAEGIDEALRAEGHFQSLADVIVGFKDDAKIFGNAIGSMINNIVTVREEALRAQIQFIELFGTIAGLENPLPQGPNFTQQQFPNDLATGPSFTPGDQPSNVVDLFAVLPTNQAGQALGGKKPEVPDSFFLRQNEQRADRLKVANDNAKRAQQAIDNVTESLEFELKQMERNTLQQEIYNNLRLAGVELDTEAGQKIKTLTTEYVRNSEELERQARLGQELENTFDDFFKTALTGADGFRGAVNGLIGSLADMALQMAILEPLKQNIFGQGSGTSGGIGGLFSGLFGGFRANGGPVTAGTSYVVGERGPELFTPSRSGSIIPNSAGNGVVINQTINVSTGVQETVAAEISALMPQIEERTRAGVNDAQLRGIA